jgi:hypothetical protein
MSTFSEMMLAVLACVMLTTSAMAADVVTLEKGDDSLATSLRLGSEKGRAVVTVKFDDGKSHSFQVSIQPDSLRKKVKQDGKSVWKRVLQGDAVIGVSGLARRHVRPRLGRYTSKQQTDLISRWSSLPSASQHWLDFEVRQDSSGVEFRLDGQYAGRRDAAGRLASLEIKASGRASVRKSRSQASIKDPIFLPLDVRRIAGPGVMQDTKLSLDSGLRTIAGKPVIVSGGVDIGVVKQCKGSWALECDEHLARTALDGMPETAHFSVPQAPYTRAWVLCAVDDDEKRDPILTARLTRFARSGRGGAISDTSITLPRGGAAPEGVVKVGSVSYETDGRKITTPLYLVEFRLKLGEIIDLLAMETDSQASMSRQPYLDFELLGKLDGLTAQWDRRHKPDAKSISAVHVFGVTLQRAAAGLRIETTQPGNIFHNDEKPEMFAIVTATRRGKVKLGWRIEDIDGSLVRESACELSFKAAGESRRVAIPLTTERLGWYGVKLSLRESNGREVIAHEAAFARLGADTRKAGYDSPYGTWWFSGAHYGVGDKEIAGPMLFKAGLRKTTFGWTKYTEADMAPWKITLNQFSWRYAPKDMSNPKKAYDDAEKTLRPLIARFPHCKYADIFHESYAHYIPPEMLDKKPDEDAAAIAAGRNRAKLGEFAAKFYRQRFPDMKLLLGNTSSSTSIVASLLRHGFDPKLIDYIGVEAVGQTGMPELLWEGSTQGIWLARQTARKFGHDIPLTGCYEFTARIERNLGPRRQAEWIARDMLLCHAYRFKHINPAILHDAGNAYFNSLWGAGGLCQRNGLLYPKPAYVGVATLTKVLDRVKPLRRVPTGSATVYALEFRRADGKIVTALWTARGGAKLTLSYAKPTAATRVGFYGRTAALARDKSVIIDCSTAPSYIIASAPAERIAIADRKLAGAPASFGSIDKMDSLKRWSLAPGDENLRQPTRRGLPIRRPGEFKLAVVKDPDRGRCLELTLRRKGEIPAIVSEYTALKLAAPIPVRGRAGDVGLWVRGDSGWGKIIFEIQDAVGAVWRTDGVWHDWPGDLAICHDGWRFVSFPLEVRGSGAHLSPGARWTSRSSGRKSRIQFPIKLTGLYVVMNRKALDLSEMKNVSGVLRLSDLGVNKTDTRD